MRLVLKTLKVQQRKNGDGHYTFERRSANPADKLPSEGYGAPTRKVGLLHAAFRPSKSACVFPFHIASKHFAVVCVRHSADMAEASGLGPQFRLACMDLADVVQVWAYELDGYGNALFTDDANIPGLLSLPCIGACGRTDPRYLATRRAVCRDKNPYYDAARAVAGIGGPHIGRDMVWPLSLMVQAITAQDPTDTANRLTVLRRTRAGTGFMHESVHKDVRPALHGAGLRGPTPCLAKPYWRR